MLGPGFQDFIRRLEALQNQVALLEGIDINELGDTLGEQQLAIQALDTRVGTF